MKHQNWSGTAWLLMLCLCAADTEITIKPPYTPAVEMTVAAGAPRGAVHTFTMKSQDSKIYPGISKKQPGMVVPYERKVAVYVPANYVAGTAAPFIIVQDGIGYMNTVVPVLDNLISQKKLPAMVAVFINSGGGDAQGSERGLEYDTLSGKYTMFVETEVLPRITTDYGITFTKDPDGRASMGGSSGAACAFTMGWFHPELYRKILSYSGTFVNQQSPMNPQSPRGAWEYHATLIPNTQAKPLRVWLEVGENDNGSKKDEASLHNWVLANQRMSAAMKAKGYQSRFIFAEGAGHVDGRVVKHTLPEALLWLWQGYPIK
jgi:enterochelin esterase-like enzyme